MHQVFVRYTKFVDLNDNGSEEAAYYGYRIFDDYEEDYNNSFDSFAEVREDINEGNVQEYVERVHPTFLDAFDETEVILN